MYQINVIIQTASGEQFTESFKKIQFLKKKLSCLVLNQCDHLKTRLFTTVGLTNSAHLDYSQ